jgi:DNA polymerase V
MTNSSNNDIWRCNPQPSYQLGVLFGSKISAGFPSPADDYIDKHLDLNEHLISHPAATYFVIASGNSMNGVGIFDKDMMIVDRSLRPASLDVVVAIIDDQLTVKKLHKTCKGKWFLLPANPKYEAIEITDSMELMIWGVVTHVVHSFRK